MLASVVEGEVRSRDQVLDSRGDENLPWSRLRGHPRAGVDCDARELVPDHLALAGVQPGPYFETQLPHPVPDRRGAADGADRAVEGGEEAVSCRIQLATAKTIQLGTHERVVASDEVRPGPVCQLEGLGRRAHDVGEQDRRKNGLGLLRPRDGGCEGDDLFGEALGLPKQGVRTADRHEPGRGNHLRDVLALAAGAL